MTEPATPPISEDDGFRKRVRWFVVVVIVLVAGAAVVLLAPRATPIEPASASAQANASAQASAPLPVSGPRVFFRDLVDADGGFGKIGFVSRGAPNDARISTSVPCVRSYFAAGRGLCMRLAKNAFHRAELVGLDAAFQPTFTLPLNGLPSRVRLSRDGAHGASTIFVTGHGYDDAEMSTQTLIVDMKDGSVLHDLEDFTLLKDGQKITAVDRNYWGVTFQSLPGRFFATVSTGGVAWLVEGDLARKELRMLAQDVECPSLSPDEKRIAYKRRVGGPGKWRLHVMDVATLTPRSLAETRNIDDQVEWLDDHHILYKQGTDVWSLDVEGNAPATTFVTRAASPSVERTRP